VTDRSGSLEIWSRSRDGQWERPIVGAKDFGDSLTQTLGALAFSPDGRTLAYQRSGEAPFEIWLSPSSGGTPVRLYAGDSSSGYQDAPTWSPDGDWIAYVRIIVEESRSRSVLTKVRVGTHETVDLAEGVAAFSQNTWSPDGNWIAVQSDDGLLRVPADGGQAEIIVNDYLLGLTWAADSRRLYGLIDAEASGHFALVEIDSTTGKVTTINPDLGTIPIANQPIRGFSFAKGQGFLTSLASARSDIWLIEGLQQPGGWLSRLLRGAR
jgi:WD40 repeat protein